MRVIQGISIMIIGAIYFTFFIQRMIKERFSLSFDNIKLFLLFILMLLISYPTTNIFRLYTIIYIHLWIISLCFELIRFICKKTNWLFEILPVMLTVGFLLFGYWNMNHVVATAYHISSSKVDSLRLIQLSDIHMSNSITVEKLQEYCNEISEYQPDYVFLTGDIFDENTPKNDMMKACEIFGNIDSKYGIYFVFGNHDSASYRKDSQFNEKDVIECLNNNKVQVLEDEVITIGNVTIIGRKDASFWGDNPREDVAKLLEGVDKNNYLILLDHQPLDLENNAKLKIDLQLSGHTHGGQLFPMRWIQSLTSDTLIYGQRTIDQFHAITSSGMSGWNTQIKTGAKSEYVIIDINNKE